MNEIKSPEISSYIYAQLISNKDAMTIEWVNVQWNKKYIFTLKYSF